MNKYLYFCVFFQENKEQLFNALKVLQNTKMQEESAVSPTQDLLSAVYNLRKSKKLLSTKEARDFEKEFLSSFNNFKSGLDYMILRYHQGVYLEFLTYRAGFDIIKDLEMICESDEIKATQDYKMRFNELTDIIEEIDDMLQLALNCHSYPIVSEESEADIEEIWKQLGWN